MFLVDATNCLISKKKKHVTMGFLSIFHAVMKGDMFCHEDVVEWTGTLNLNVGKDIDTVKVVEDYLLRNGFVIEAACQEDLLAVPSSATSLVDIDLTDFDDEIVETVSVVDRLNLDKNCYIMTDDYDSLKQMKSLMYFLAMFSASMLFFFVPVIFLLINAGALVSATVGCVMVGLLLLTALLVRLLEKGGRVVKINPVNIIWASMFFLEILWASVTVYLWLTVPFPYEVFPSWYLQTALLMFNIFLFGYAVARILDYGMAIYFKNIFPKTYSLLSDAFVR